MTEFQKKIVTILCVSLMAAGIIIGLIELALYVNWISVYVLSAGVSLLVILGAFEIIERSKDKE